MLHNPILALGAVGPPPYSVTLAWARSPSSAVAGYRVYYGTVSGSYTNSVVVGNLTTNTVSGLASGVTYFFAVTAYNTNGLESPYSNEISFVPGTPTLGIRIAANGQAVLTVKGLIGRTYEIQASQTFAGWTVIGAVTLGPSGSVEFTDTNPLSFPRRFYRTRLTP